MQSSAEFYFRVWIHPLDGDPPEVETWCQELVPTTGTRLGTAEWACNHLQELDVREFFSLDPDKHWQVIGKGIIHGHFCHLDEYDESLEVLEHTCAEVPESWYAHNVLDFGDADTQEAPDAV